MLRSGSSAATHIWTIYFELTESSLSFTEGSSSRMPPNIRHQSTISDLTTTERTVTTNRHYLQQWYSILLSPSHWHAWCCQVSHTKGIWNKPRPDADKCHKPSLSRNESIYQSPPPHSAARAGMWGRWIQHKHLTLLLSVQKCSDGRSKMFTKFSILSLVYLWNFRLITKQLNLAITFKVVIKCCNTHIISTALWLMFKIISW